MKATVGNLRKLIQNLPDDAKIVVEDWDGAYLIKQNHTKNKDMELEELLMSHDDRLIIINERATENECHHWDINAPTEQ